MTGSAQPADTGNEQAGNEQAAAEREEQTYRAEVLGLFVDDFGLRPEELATTASLLNWEAIYAEAAARVDDEQPQPWETPLTQTRDRVAELLLEVVEAALEELSTDTRADHVFIPELHPRLFRSSVDADGGRRSHLSSPDEPITKQSARRHLSRGHR